MAKRKTRETTTRTRAVFTAGQLAELKGTVREFLRLFNPRTAFEQDRDGNHFRVTRVAWDTHAMLRVFQKAQDFTNRITLGDRYGKKSSDDDPLHPAEWSEIASAMLTFQKLDARDAVKGKIEPAAVEAANRAEDVLSRFVGADPLIGTPPAKTRSDFEIIRDSVGTAQGFLLSAATLVFENLLHHIAMVREVREQDKACGADGEIARMYGVDGGLEAHQSPIAELLRDGQQYLRAVVSHLAESKARTKAAATVVPRSIEPDPIGYETRLNAAIEDASRVAQVNLLALESQSRNVSLSMSEARARNAQRECQEAADALDSFHRVWRSLPAEAPNRVERPDFHLTTDIRATSDPLWKHLAAFRRRLMDGGKHAPADWQSLLIDIRTEAHAAGLRPQLGKVEYIVATLNEARDGDPAGGWEREPDSWSKVILTASRETGWIQLHDLVDGFTDANIPASGHKRTSAIEWAESWMNARERQLAEPAAVDPRAIERAAKRAAAKAVEAMETRDNTGIGGTDTDWKEVQGRLLAKRERGEPYTSLRTLCAELGCSDATIRKAIRDSAVLKGWQARSKGRKAAPKATDLGAVVRDNTGQTTELAPDDVLPNDDVDATMRRLIEQAKPDVRAKLNALSSAGRRALVAAYQSQKLDDEPSPLEPDKPGERPRKVKQHKRA